MVHMLGMHQWQAWPWPTKNWSSSRHMPINRGTMIRWYTVGLFLVSVHFSQGNCIYTSMGEQAHCSLCRTASAGGGTMARVTGHHPDQWANGPWAWKVCVPVCTYCHVTLWFKIWLQNPAWYTLSMVWKDLQTCPECGEHCIDPFSQYFTLPPIIRVDSARTH